MLMYTWGGGSAFLAVARAGSVNEARKLVLAEMGESGDGSCPERDKARERVLNTNPSMWTGPNAEFALTDSAELREQEDYSRKLFDQVEVLKSQRDALAALIKAHLDCGEFQHGGRNDCPDLLRDGLEAILAGTEATAQK